MADAGEMAALVSREMVAAMKAHDAERTGTLRLIMTALKNKSIDKREPLTPAESEQALASMIKQRRDSIEQFTKGNRPELAAKEAAEIAVIEEFLPKALDEAGLAALVNDAIAELTASLGHKPKPEGNGRGHEGRAGQTASRRHQSRWPRRQRAGEKIAGWVREQRLAASF